MPFLFDGYNVYHAARKLSEEWAHITLLTFCNHIVEDMRCLKDHAVVVFDGRQPPVSLQEAQASGLIKIIFSGRSSDADSLLEKLIKKNTAPRRLIVVSSDNRVRRAARRRRATILTSPEYLQMMLLRKEKTPTRLKEPREKRRGLNSDQLNEWLDIFGIEPADSNDQYSL